MSQRSKVESYSQARCGSDLINHVLDRNAPLSSPSLNSSLCFTSFARLICTATSAMKLPTLFIGVKITISGLQSSLSLYSMCFYSPERLLDQYYSLVHTKGLPDDRIYGEPKGKINV